MKKRSRILVLILTAMLSTEPVQIVYAETAEATHVTSESTSVNPKEENADNSAVVPPKADPGWVAVEKRVSMAAGRWYFTSEIGLGNDQRQEILSP